MSACIPPGFGGFGGGEALAADEDGRAENSDLDSSAGGSDVVEEDTGGCSVAAGQSQHSALLLLLAGLALALRRRRD